MSQIILPPIALFNIERERMAERHGHLSWFEGQLKLIDWRLSLVRASEQAQARDLTPGYWHIKRDNSEQGVMDSYLPITGPNGQFMEPHAGVLEQLRSGDLQRPGAWEAMIRKQDREDQERAGRLADQRAEWKDEFATRYKAKVNPGVSFSDRPWRYRKERSK